MAYKNTQLDSKAERDKINEAMRASPLWRDTIKGMGLNPDGPLKLTKDQQGQMASVFGIDTKDFHFDGAGNINDFHGWKGLPTAAKIAIIAGATAATAGIGSTFGGTAPLVSTPLEGYGVTTAAVAPKVVAAATPSVWDRVKSFATGHVADLAKVGGVVATNIADQSEANRLAQVKADIEAERNRQQARRDYESALIAREQEKRTSEQDAWSKLQKASYVKNWTAPVDTSSSAKYTDPRTGPNADVKSSADALIANSQARLTGGSTLPPLENGSNFAIDPARLNPTGFEKVAGYAGAGLGAFDLIRKLAEEKRKAAA